MATYDGDTPGEEREWVRSHANVVLTNPDMLHHSMLPGHHRWSSFLRTLHFVVVDEIHTTAACSAPTSRSPASAAKSCRALRQPTHLSLGLGDGGRTRAAAAVDSPGSRYSRSPMTHRPGVRVFALMGTTADRPRRGARRTIRRTAPAEVADLLADLVIDDARTLAFVRSRRGAEVVALLARPAGGVDSRWVAGGGLPGAATCRRNGGCWSADCNRGDLTGCRRHQRA